VWLIRDIVERCAAVRGGVCLAGSERGLEKKEPGEEDGGKDVVGVDRCVSGNLGSGKWDGDV